MRISDWSSDACSSDLLAASYGLVLHGSGVVRIKAGLHYVTINVATSLLFLIGVSLIYAVTGTLNMADLAARIPLMATSDLALLEGGAAILGIAFLVKAGMWRSEEQTSELQSLMRISYAVFCLKKKKQSEHRIT